MCRRFPTNPVDITAAAFWTALGSIILANVLLSGDNAVVIALAARGLPAHQQRRAIVLGSAAAIVLRIVLTLIAVQLLTLPYLKIAGGLLLLYIGVSLMHEDEGVGAPANHPVGLGAAVRTILVADLVMSLDNVLAVAAAAHGDTVLLVLGLGISIPLIVFGSTMLLRVMERYPLIITAGAALLGWLAGEMIATDPALSHWLGGVPRAAAIGAAVAGAVLVVVLGRYIERRQRAA